VTALLLPLFSVMSGKMAVCIPRGLCAAAVVVVVLMVFNPTQGRDSPRKCRAAALQSHSCSPEPQLWSTGSE
jgi:hypothetical protein